VAERESFTARAHPNIALVKYWGKADPVANIPAVPSLSITLNDLETRTTVRRSPDGRDHFRFQGKAGPRMESRVFACLDDLRRRTGFEGGLEVESENNFPTAAGLASSASGFAALVVAAAGLMGGSLDQDELADVARRASGSAARSLFGGIVELELTPDGPHPTRCRQLLPPGEWPLEVVVAVTDDTPKKISSSTGMAWSRERAPFYRAWIESAGEDLRRARNAVEERDFETLAEISEHSCLKMHGLMLSTPPGLLYFRAATVACLHRIRRLREEGCSVFFTVDAGPQVKAVCLPGAAPMVREALEKIPGVLRLLDTSLGEGASLIES